MIKLKNLFLGNIDAKHELINYSEQEQKQFLDSFLIPENIDISQFVNLRKFFITGMKGTGKTALLRYIGLELENKHHSTVRFVLFKSDFSDEEKKKFSRAARTILADKEVDDSEDYQEIWQWFIYRNIVKIVEDEKKIIFENDDNWKKFSTCIKAPKTGDEKSGLMSLLPKLKRGNIEIAGGIEVIKGKLYLDFDWEDNERTRVKFSNLVRQTDELFKRLTPTKGANQRLNILFDELELTLENTKQYSKDSRLIRDLMFAISDLNITSIERKYNLGFLAAIRSEVISSIGASGKELNKIILDFGVPVEWSMSGGNINNHPLLTLIIKRLETSKRFNGINETTSAEELWEEYFPEVIHNQLSQNYILHQTWHRPRDIVRLLGLCKDKNPNENSFTHQVFDSIKKEYSKQCWVEHVEELRTKLTAEETEGLRKIVLGIKSPFTLNEITLIVDQKKLLYKDVEDLMEKFKLGEVLSLLYKVGVIGNTGERVRFEFRGDNDVLLEKPMKIHDALWNYLSIEN